MDESVQTFAITFSQLFNLFFLSKKINVYIYIYNRFTHFRWKILDVNKYKNQLKKATDSFFLRTWIQL